jgi:hypothetical protein
MIIPIQISDSLALRARAEAINSSVHGALDRFVASLLATSAHTIRRSRGAIFPSVVHPLYEMRRDRSARDDSEEA